MTKLVALLFLTCLTVHAADLDKASLKRALETAKTPAEIQKAIKDLGAYGANKDEMLAKRIGKDNFTYFMMTVKEGELKGLDLRIKGASGQRSMTILNRLVKNWNFIAMDEVKRLAVGKTTGSFFVDNDCVRGTILFEMNAKGVVTKMVIPRLNTKSMNGGKVIFATK